MAMFSIDAAVIFECTNTNSAAKTRAGIIRPLAPFALHNVLQQRDIPATVFNYVDFWQADALLESVSCWLEKHRPNRPAILCSTLFNDRLLTKNTKVNKIISALKQTYPDLQIIIGGPINLIDYDLDNIIPDAVFQGRSLHLFEKWLDGEDVGEAVTVTQGVPLYHDPSSKIVERPIVPKLYDDYCLCPEDILQFEVRLGCKFNCAFCTFEFRNAKKVEDTTSEELVDFFTSASRYGITRFSCVDDTFNEDDDKIKTLHDAVSQLSFKPKIVGYNRFDIMMARRHQVDLLNECGFVGHYFGIETLHRDASKLIRKGVWREPAFEFLREIKRKHPHWHICSGYIVGIPLEPVEHITETMQQIRNEQLLDAVIPVDLGIYQVPGNEHNFSDFGKNPEKFGLTILGGDPMDLDWTHEHMNKKMAKVLARKLASQNIKEKVTTLDPWEAISRDALGSDDMFSVEKLYKTHVAENPSELYSDKWNVLGKEFIAQYILRKQNYVLSLTV